METRLLFWNLAKGSLSEFPLGWQTLSGSLASGRAQGGLCSCLQEALWAQGAGRRGASDQQP